MGGKNIAQEAFRISAVSLALPTPTANFADLEGAKQPAICVCVARGGGKACAPHMPPHVYDQVSRILFFLKLKQQNGHERV